MKTEILSKVRAVPPLPEVILKLRECCNDPNVQFASMAKVIDTDAGLTSSILRLANSAYFGCAGSISSGLNTPKKPGSSSKGSVKYSSLTTSSLRPARPSRPWTARCRLKTRSPMR